MRKSGSLKHFLPDLSEREADAIRITANPADLVELVGSLRSKGVPTEKLARARSCKPYEIRHLMRLQARLSDPCKEFLRKGRISLGHARALASLPKTEQVGLAYECIDAQWSVRALESRIRGDQHDDHPTAKPTEWAAHYERIAQVAGDQLGYPCRFQLDKGNERAGELSLRFTSLAELDGILRRLRIRLDDD